MCNGAIRLPDAVCENAQTHQQQYVKLIIKNEDRGSVFHKNVIKRESLSQPGLRLPDTSAQVMRS
jgi:hypothetical protein